MKRVPLLIKGLVLLLLALLLLIPLGMVDGLVDERMHRQHQVETEIANSTAQPQLLAGPLVTINYTESWVDKISEQKTDGDKLWHETREVDRKVTRTKLVYPEQLQMSGQMAVEPRKRGIFAAQVYQFDGRLSGQLNLPGLADLAVREDSKITINSALASLLVADRKGFIRQPTLILGTATLPFKPGTGLPVWDAGVHANIAKQFAEQSKIVAFEVPLLLQGTSRFAVIPLADSNRFSVTGNWSHPSFDGQFLPLDREVQDGAFSAEWQVTSMASSAQSQLKQGMDKKELFLSNLQGMGVSLIDPVSVYSNTDRALKYGFLFVGLTFASFFLYELLMRLRIHPVQYGLVGVAQALFFLLLLSFSEHLDFAMAYLLAMLSCVGIVGTYLASVLGSRIRGASFATALALLYGVLYLLLQSEDYALLSGSLVLFGLLAGAMMITRKLDWYGLESQLNKS